MKKIKDLYEKVEELFLDFLSKGLNPEEEVRLFLELFDPLKEKFKEITIINPTDEEKKLYRKMNKFFDFSKINHEKIKEKKLLFFQKMKKVRRIEKIPMESIMEKIEEFEEKFEDFPRT